MSNKWRLFFFHLGTALHASQVARVESQKLLRSPRFGRWESRHQPINHPEKKVRSSSEESYSHRVCVLELKLCWEKYIVVNMLHFGLFWEIQIFIGVSDVWEAPVLELEGSMQAMPFHGTHMLSGLYSEDVTCPQPHQK